ncbi:VOC family protein [Bacillus sp. JCM 19041]|uniref:VOC family protein n=1 Tax=Bacillus sp. JCM 19041 TaxID=1460637 RepID=UPI0006CF9A4A
MNPNINIVTIPVEDLSVSKKFYIEVFNLSDESVSVGEDHIALFLDGDMSLVVFELRAFAEMIGQKLEDISTSVILTYKVKNAEAVDSVLAKVEQAKGYIYQKGTSDEYSYSGTFKDPDRHMWEVISWNE